MSFYFSEIIEATQLFLRLGPVKMIIGETEVVRKLIMDKEKLWQETQTYAGITKRFYD